MTVLKSENIFVFCLFCTLCIPFLSSAQSKYKVVATASIFADMAKNIAADRVVIESIVPVGGDPHLHEPTPRDARIVAAADLILVNGLTFEGWLNELIENAGTNATIVRITEGITPIQSLTYKNATDPHAWMDAQNGLVYIKNIKDALIALDSEGREQYEFNYGVYKQQLEDLDQYIARRIAEIPKAQRTLITSHDAFQYFGRKYGLQLEAILGISTDAEVQTSDITRLTQVIRNSNLPAVFIESTVNPKLLKQIAKDNKVKIGGQLFSDSIGDEDSPASSYYDMLKYNTDTIVEALKQSADQARLVEQENKRRSINDYGFFAIVGLLLIGVLFFLVRKMNL